MGRIGRRALPHVSVSPAHGAYVRTGERVITVGSDVGGCLISLSLRGERLHIEVYRADDTVDVVAPATTLLPRDMTHMGRSRDAHDQRMIDGA